MLRNDRQLRGAKAKLAELQTALADESDAGARRALHEMIEMSSSGIRQYEDVRGGQISEFVFNSLDELGQAVIAARLAKGLSVRELSEALGITEQQVSKDESREYEAAGVAKVADVLDALEFEVIGCVRPKRAVREIRTDTVSAVRDPRVTSASSSGTSITTTASWVHYVNPGTSAMARALTGQLCNAGFSYTYDPTPIDHHWNVSSEIIASREGEPHAH